MIANLHTRAWSCATLLSALCICGCAPKYVRPSMPAPLPDAYKESAPGTQLARQNGWKQANPSDAMLRGKWWEIFGDPQLNQLEERLDINDQNIKQYFENYMAARAVVRNARASYFPTISAGPSANAQGAGAASTSRLSSSTSSRSYSLSGTVSWEPDFFGIIRREVTAQARAAQVSAADLANETLSEQASLAQYYFELRGQDALIAVYGQTIDQYRQSLQLTQSLYRTGIDSDQDVSQAEVTLHNAEANAVSIATTRAQYEHAIAVLVGASASSFSLPSSPLQFHVPIVPAGVPSQLLERRPDIAAAERTVAEYNSLIGVYKAAYFPSISLTGGGGTQSADLMNVVNADALFWSVGGSAAETLIDFGARRANVQRYEALYRSNVAAYRETVLTAFREVEDYLVASRQLADQAGREKQAVDSASRYLKHATTLYRTGLDSYLNVITAQTSLLSSSQSLVEIQTQQMTSAVQLMTALGGGWNVSELPSEKKVGSKP